MNNSDDADGQPPTHSGDIQPTERLSDQDVTAVPGPQVDSESQLDTRRRGQDGQDGPDGRDTQDTGKTSRDAHKTTHVGRRTVIGVAAAGIAGIAFGARVDDTIGGALTKVSSALGGLPIPGADEFRIYTVTGTIPDIPPAKYRLQVDGLVDKPLTLSLADLKAMPRVQFTRFFQCVTGWRVPEVHWAGVALADVLKAAGLKPGATALRFFSGDGVYTESLTLAQAHLPQVIVADEMIGDTVAPEHGGPVRLYVAPMYGYKSIKWLDRIQVVDQIVPGYWENLGYAVNGWIGGSQ